MNFISDDFIEQAEQNPVGLAPTGFVENTASSYEAFVATDQSLSRDKALFEEYEGYVRRIEDETGAKLINPILFKFDRRKKMIATFDEQVQELSEEHDDFLPLFYDDIVESALIRLRGIVEENERIAMRATGMGEFGQFVGAAGGAITDPVVMATLPLGAASSAGLLRTAMIEAGVAGGTEAALQPGVQAFRKEVGVKSGLEEGISNVVVAAGAGGAFGFAFKGAAIGFKKLLEAHAEARPNPTIEERDAIRVIQEEIETEETIPPVRSEEDATAAAGAHQENIVAADKAMQEGRPVRADEIQTAPFERIEERLFDPNEFLGDVEGRLPPPARFEIGKPTGKGKGEKFRNYTPVRPGDRPFIEGVIALLRATDRGERIFIEQDGAGGTPQVVGRKSDTPEFFQEENKRRTATQKERKKVLKANEKLPPDQQIEPPRSERVIKRQDMEKVADKLLAGEPLGRFEAGVAEVLMDEARQLRTQNAEEFIAARGQRTRDIEDEIDAIAEREAADIAAVGQGMDELVEPHGPDVAANFRTGTREARAGQAAERLEGYDEDQAAASFLAEADRILKENPDAEVAIGETVDADGNKIPLMKRVDELIEDLKQDEEFNAQVKDCLG